MSTQNPTKRIRIDGEAGERRMKVDRLSSLPDHILHLVLSSLTATNFAVQTSVLSRRWRSLWKQVPRLTLDTNLFSRSSFARYVDEVLSRRPDGCNVDEIVYSHLNPDFSQDKPLFHRVMEFAASHGTRQLIICVRCDDEPLDSYLFAPLADSNLITLRLRQATLGTGFGDCEFRMLTILDLDEVWLPCSSASDRDPFANFPCLENLMLCNCSLEDDQCCFKINGRRLVKLMIYDLDCFKLEIFAPKLKVLDYMDDLMFPRVYSLTLPSLDHANIWVTNKCFGEKNMEDMKACYISLLHGVRNAASLNVYSGVFELLSKNCQFLELEHQSSPFTRLKSLKVVFYSSRWSYKIPSRVLNYFLNGSPIREQATIEFVWEV